MDETRTIRTEFEELTPEQAMRYMCMPKSTFYSWCHNWGVQALEGGVYTIKQLQGARLREINKKGGA